MKNRDTLKKFNDIIKHYWDYGLFIGWVFIVIIISKIFPSYKQSNNIVFFSTRFNGNVEVFYQYLKKHHPGEFTYSYVSNDPNQHKVFKKNKNYGDVQTLSSQKFTDVLKVSRSKAIISANSFSYYYHFKKLKKRPALIDTFHGVGYKGTEKDITAVARSTDRFFQVSDYINKWWIKRYDMDARQHVTTGYARIDPLVTNSVDVRAVKKELGLDLKKKIVLFAPTWKHDDKTKGIVPYKMSINSFFKQMDELGKKIKATIVFRAHHHSIIKATSQYKNIRFISINDYPLTYQLLAATDVLITDWSSIVGDFIVSRRPTIFFDIPPPWNCGDYLPTEDRAGYRVKNLNELKNSISEAILKPQIFEEKFGKDMDRVIKRAHGMDKKNTLDGKCCERYYKELHKVLKEVEQ